MNVVNTKAEIGRPSVFVLAHLDALRAAVADAVEGSDEVLDLACGGGRNAVALAHAGLSVVGLDRARGALEALSRVAVPTPGAIRTVQIDLETDPSPSLGSACYAGIVVSRYLHRTLAPAIEAALAPGGLLLYETFTIAQRTLGWGPKRDAFLLAPGELRTLFPGLEIVEYAEGLSRDDPAAESARLLARRPLR